MTKSGRPARWAAVLAPAAIILALAAPAWGASGAFDRAWGGNVDSVAPGLGFEICVVGANCQAGTNNGFGGEMSLPDGVAVDPAGNVYVAANNRIQKFDSSGNFLRAWGKDVVDSGPGQTAGTGFEICVAADGDVCGSAGNPDTGLGGEIDFAGAIATDAASNVYVADRQDNRIQKFDSSGNFLLAWGKDVAATGPGNTGAGFEICVAANVDVCKAGVSGGLGGELNQPFGVATDSAGAVYVTDFNQHRIQKFDSSGNFQRLWGKDVTAPGGPGNTTTTGFEICVTLVDVCKAADAPTVPSLGGEMSAPLHLGTDSAGDVYVADTSNNRIQKFDSSGNFLRAWGKDVAGTGQGNTGAGFEICVAANGDTCQAGLAGGLGGELAGPGAVAIDSANNLYVTEQNGNRIQRFDTSGSFQRAWGEDVDSVAVSLGFEICTVAANCKAATTTVPALGGEMNTPFGADTDAAGNVYVADRLNHRIQKFADPSPATPLTPAATPPGFDLAAAIKKCKKKFRKGKKRKKCIKRAKALATA